MILRAARPLFTLDPLSVAWIEEAFRGFKVPPRASLFVSNQNWSDYRIYNGVPFSTQVVVALSGVSVEDIAKAGNRVEFRKDTDTGSLVKVLP